MLATKHHGQFEPKPEIEYNVTLEDGLTDDQREHRPMSGSFWIYHPSQT